MFPLKGYCTAYLSLFGSRLQSSTVLHLSEKCRCKKHHQGFISCEFGKDLPSHYSYLVWRWNFCILIFTILQKLNKINGDKHLKNKQSSLFLGLWAQQTRACVPSLFFLISSSSFVCTAFVCVILSSEPAVDNWQAEQNVASLRL